MTQIKRIIADLISVNNNYQCYQRSINLYCVNPIYINYRIFAPSRLFYRSA